jgi:hypothetical protein
MGWCRDYFMSTDLAREIKVAASDCKVRMASTVEPLVTVASKISGGCESLASTTVEYWNKFSQVSGITLSATDRYVRSIRYWLYFTILMVAGYYIVVLDLSRGQDSRLRFVGSMIRRRLMDRVPDPGDIQNANNVAFVFNYAVVDDTGSVPVLNNGNITIRPLFMRDIPQVPFGQGLAAVDRVNVQLYDHLKANYAYVVNDMDTRRMMFATAKEWKRRCGVPDDVFNTFAAITIEHAMLMTPTERRAVQIASTVNAESSRVLHSDGRYVINYFWRLLARVFMVRPTQLQNELGNIYYSERDVVPHNMNC